MLITNRDRDSRIRLIKIDGLRERARAHGAQISQEINVDRYRRSCVNNYIASAYKIIAHIKSRDGTSAAAATLDTGYSTMQRVMRVRAGSSNLRFSFAASVARYSFRQRKILAFSASIIRTLRILLLKLRIH